MLYIGSAEKEKIKLSTTIKHKSKTYGRKWLKSLTIDRTYRIMITGNRKGDCYGET